MLEYALQRPKTAATCAASWSAQRCGLRILAAERHLKRIEALLGPQDASWFAVYIISSMLLPTDGSTNSDAALLAAESGEDGSHPLLEPNGGR